MEAIWRAWGDARMRKAREMDSVVWIARAIWERAMIMFFVSRLWGIVLGGSVVGRMVAAALVRAGRADLGVKVDSMRRIRAFVTFVWQGMRLGERLATDMIRRAAAVIWSGILDWRM